LTLPAKLGRLGVSGVAHLGRAEPGEKLRELTVHRPGWRHQRLRRPGLGLVKQDGPQPAPAPSEPARPIEPEKPAAASPAAWSVVSEAKESAQTTVDEPKKKKKGKRDAADAPPGGWALASGNSPGMEADEVIRAPSQLIALAQYAILVVGLVMVLIGVLVMVANSHGT